MKRIHLGIAILLLLPASILPAETSNPSFAVRVDCSDGQSLNRALSRLPKRVAATVFVNGTCSEYVQVNGFENLTLKGLPGAKLTQPDTPPGSSSSSVLAIGASRSITASGFTIEADTTVNGIEVGHGSNDIRLENLNIQGGGEGIIVFEQSQVLVAHVVGKDAGWTPLGIYDASDVHIEHCLFQNSTVTQWHVGIDVGASHITMFDTAIRDFQVGINARAGSVIDTIIYTTYTPFGGPSDIIIDSPLGVNFNGVYLDAGASLNVDNARLFINQAGQPWGGETAGIFVQNGSTLNAWDGQLAIEASRGHGVLVMDNSHATLAGAAITGSGHGGVVLSNLSSLNVAPGGNLTVIGANGVDLFCDATSVITGRANLAGIPSSQCANVSPGHAELP
jgi:hypothetical protein